MATSASTAELFPVAEVHAAMRRQAQLAVEHLSSAKVMTTRSPLRVIVRAVPPANMTWLKGMPGLAYDDESVTFTAADAAAAYRGIRPIVTALSFASAERSAFNAQPNVAQLRLQGMQEVYRRWFAAESGQAVQPATPPKKKEYHGFN